jgi:hypothetical protein
MDFDSASAEARRLYRVAEDRAKRFAASEHGRALRRYAATGLIAAAPVVVSMPVLRRTRLGRLVEVAGGAALIVAVAEKIRDWEPEQGHW